MRDARAEALAQILVRYSTRVGKGDVCVIQSTSAAEVLVQAVYEEVLRAGGLPILQLSTDGAQAAFFDLASDEQLDWIPPTSEWTVENAAARDRGHGRRQRARAVGHRPRQAVARVARTPGPDGDLDAARCRRRVPLGPHAVPHARVRERGGHVPARLRGLLLRRLPGHGRRSGHRVGAPGGRGQAAGGVDRGQGRGARDRAGHRHHPRRGGPPLDPVLRRAQHARRRVLHRPGRGRGQRRDRLLVPGQLRRAHGGGRAAALRGRQGRGRARPSRARTS